MSYYEPDNYDRDNYHMTDTSRTGFGVFGAQAKPSESLWLQYAHSMQSSYKYICRLRLDTCYSSPGTHICKASFEVYLYTPSYSILMTSFTSLSFPIVGVSSQHAQFGDDMLMSARRLGGFVSSKWKSAVGDTRPKRSMIRRLSSILYGEEENEETSSSEPGSTASNSSQPASPEPGLPRRRFSMSPSITETEINIMSPGNHPGE